MAIRPSSRENAKPADSDFPFGRYTNEGEPGYPTGTAIKQEEIMDATLPWQLLLKARGNVPSGVQETASASQYYTALLQTFAGLEMQVGMLFAFPYSYGRPLLPPGYELLSLHTAENAGSDIPFSITDHPLLATRFPEGVLPNMEGRTITGQGNFGYVTKALGEKGNGAVLNAVGVTRTGERKIDQTPALDTGIFYLVGNGISYGAFTEGHNNTYLFKDTGTDLSLQKYAGQSGSDEGSTPYQNNANGVYSKHLTVEWMCLADSPTSTLAVPSTFSVSSTATRSIVAPKRYSSVVFKDNTAIFSKLVEKIVPLTSKNGVPLLDQNGRPTTKKITKEIPAWRVTF